MYKASCVAALLLGTFALTSGSKPADASASGLPSPVIVARASLVNHTAALPQTTIFTPTQTGVYRVSAYIAMTTASSTGFWTFEFCWTDEGGTNLAQMLNLDSTRVPAYGTDPSGNPVGSFTFRAIAGQPVSYDVTDGGTGAGGTYEVFFTIERLF